MAGGLAKRRTTVRIPEELHHLLRYAAVRDNTTSEAIIEEALQRELERRKQAEVRQLNGPPDDWGPVLAEMFLQFLPTPCAIKDKNRRIVWVNFSYEELCQMPLFQLEGKTLKDAGLIDYISKESEKKIEDDINDIFTKKKPKECYEELVIKGKRVLIRAQRFLLGTATELLGDISFDFNRILQDRWAVSKTVLDRMRKMLVPSHIQNLFMPFLEAAPISIAVKKLIDEGRDSEIVWANTEYKDLAKPGIEVIKNTTRNVFGLEVDHPVVWNDRIVAESKVALYDKTRLPERIEERWSLRFPMFDEKGRVKYIGVVSPNFGHAESSDVQQNLVASA